MSTAVKEKVCSFCGPYEKCAKKFHTQKHLNDLLVDAGIIEDTSAAFNKWMQVSHKNTDPNGHLLGYAPNTVWDVYQWRVAKYVRSIL